MLKDIMLLHCMHTEQSDINIKCKLHSHELLSYNVPYVACSVVM